MAAGGRVGMDKVEVRIRYGKRSNPESDRLCDKIKDSVKQVVQHADILRDKTLEDLALTDQFSVFVNKKKIYLSEPAKKVNVNKIVEAARVASGGDTFVDSQAGSLF